MTILNKILPQFSGNKAFSIALRQTGPTSHPSLSREVIAEDLFSNLIKNFHTQKHLQMFICNLEPKVYSIKPKFKIQTLASTKMSVLEF
jgi:hypothetical protein